jgi:L-iditol 2-dehydrogenase
MKAAVFHGVGVIRLQDIPRPIPGAREALLRIGSVGICGTDLRIFATGHHRIPAGTARVLGHEVAGEIVEVGQDVSGLFLGMRVAVAPNMGCGVCPPCVAGWTNLCPNYTAFGVSLDGGFAEYMLITEEAIRQGNVVEIPAGIPDHIAALAEPLSCCINGQEALHIGLGDVVLVIGAGPIGLMHLQLAKISGARQVIVSDSLDQRLEQAAAHGADILVNPQKDDLATAVLQGVDAIIIAAPSPDAQEQALELASPRGRINLFGGLPGDRPFIRFNSNLVHYKQLVVTGTTGSNMRHFRAAMDLIASGRVQLESLSGARLPLERIHEGIRLAQSRTVMRVHLEPSLEILRKP